MNINNYYNYFNDIPKLKFNILIDKLKLNYNLKKIIEFFILNKIKFYDVNNDEILIKEKKYLILFLDNLKIITVSKINYIIINNLISNNIDLNNIDIIKNNINFQLNYLQTILSFINYLNFNYNILKNIFILKLDYNFIAIYKNE